MKNNNQNQRRDETKLEQPTSHSNPVNPSAKRTTTTVRHRLPRWKVNNVWKPLSNKTCDLLEGSLAESIDETTSNEDFDSIRRIEILTKQLTTQIRVPTGVYTGIKLNQEGKVDLVSIEDLRKKNSQLESLVQLRQSNSSNSDSKNKNR